MTDTEILKAALVHLWDGVGIHYFKYWHICHCIMEVGEQANPVISDRVYDRCDDIVKIIEDRLDGHLTLDHWLKAQGVVLKNFSKKDFQEHRRKWLLILIEEAEKNGGYLK